MRAFARTMAGLVACAMWGGAVHAAPSADQAAQIREVIRLSGLEVQLERIPQQMQAQLDARRDDLKAHVFGRVHDAMADAFHADRLRQSVTDSLSQRADAEKLQQSIDWLKSPIGSRMTALETAASAPDAGGALREYIAQLESQPPTPERVELVKRMSVATGAPDAAMKLMQAMVQGMARALDAAEGGQSAVAQEEAKQAIAQLEGQRPLIEQGILIKLLFTYRDASDQELMELATFWESDLGRWLNQATVESFITALGQSSEAMARELAPLIQAE